MKEIKEDTNKWKDTQCSGIRRMNIVKMSILPKAIYRLNVITIKISMAFLHRNFKKNPKIYVEPQKALIVKPILRKNKVRGRMLPDFKL